MKKPSKSVKAMREARNPTNTCAASRHVELIAERLVAGEPCPILTDEPEYCGESMAATVAALWAARTEIKRLRAALSGMAALDEEYHQRGHGDEDICAEVRAAYDALEPNVEVSAPGSDGDEHGI